MALCAGSRRAAAVTRTEAYTRSTRTTAVEPMTRRYGRCAACGRELRLNGTLLPPHNATPGRPLWYEGERSNVQFFAHWPVK